MLLTLQPKVCCHPCSFIMHLTKCETLLSCKNSLSEKLLKQNWYWLGNLGSEEVPQILNLCVFSFSRSDCVEILKKCGDQNKFPEDHTAESICELLSPTDDLENCIPLDTYLSKYFFFFNLKASPFYLCPWCLLCMSIYLLRTCGLMIISHLQTLTLFACPFQPRKELLS